VIAHYSYAKLHPENQPILHTFSEEFGKNYGKLRTRIETMLSTYDLDRRTDRRGKLISGKECFEDLFSMNPFQLIVPPENINFDHSALDFIMTETYRPQGSKISLSCLQYSK
jgi:hypothetical protein